MSKLRTIGARTIIVKAMSSPTHTLTITAEALVHALAGIEEDVAAQERRAIEFEAPAIRKPGDAERLIVLQSRVAVAERLIDVLTGRNTVVSANEIKTLISTWYGPGPSTPA